MCLESLARRSVFVELEKSNVDVDQLLGRLVNVYMMFVEDGVLRQSYLFSLESNASKFFRQVFSFLGVICAGFHS